MVGVWDTSGFKSSGAFRKRRIDRGALYEYTFYNFNQQRQRVQITPRHLCVYPNFLFTFLCTVVNLYWSYLRFQVIHPMRRVIL